MPRSAIPLIPVGVVAWFAAVGAWVAVAQLGRPILLGGPLWLIGLAMLYVAWGRRPAR